VTFEEITSEFYQENKNNLGQFMSKSHKRGPYTKQELEKRRNEVYRLHLEYGYSARKIADMMSINRNTINGDIHHWYSKVTKSNDGQAESTIFVILERLDVQRTRIREYLDTTSNISEKITIEKMILDLDYKIAQIHQKIFESSRAMMDFAIKFLNEHLKVQNQTQRYCTFGQKMAVSDPAIKRIDKIIAQDKKNLWGKQN
jgi:DNA-binding CsgD family transcriptional regulator